MQPSSGKTLTCTEMSFKNIFKILLDVTLLYKKQHRVQTNKNIKSNSNVIDIAFLNKLFFVVIQPPVHIELIFPIDVKCSLMGKSASPTNSYMEELSRIFQNASIKWTCIFSFFEPRRFFRSPMEVFVSGSIKSFICCHS